MFCLAEVHHGNVKLMIVRCKTKLKLFAGRLAHVRLVQLQLGPHGICGNKKNYTEKKKEKIFEVPFGVPFGQGRFGEPLGTL